jgi:ubiquinone/menaquinone biosynthesis C-methylase UbiE
MDDVEGIGGDELEETLRELRVINRRLGGHRTSLRGLDDLIQRAGVDAGRPLTLLDVGGGSGDVAPAIVEWGRRRGFDVHVTVADIHPETVDLARSHLQDVASARVLQADLFDLEEDSFDIVHAALFLHHFDGDEAVRALRAMARIARVGVVVNDLHRHPVPWALIRWITGAVSQNRLIRADAPHSVARAFVAEDWRRLGPAAGLSLTWRRSWAWRWAVAGVPA